MAGLLDFSSPEMRQAIGLLAAAGPTREPRSFGQRAQGLLQQLDAQQAEAEDRKQRQLMQAMQMQQMQEAAAARKQAMQQQQQRRSYLGGIDQSQGPAMPFNPASALAAGLQPDEIKALMSQQGKGPEYKVVNGSLVRIDGDRVSEAFRAPEKPGEGPTSVQEYKYGLTDPKFAAWQREQVNLKAPRTDVRLSMPFETEYKKGQGKAFSETMETLNKAGFAAPQQIRKLERLEQLLEGVDGGKLAPLGLEVASAANSFGVKLDPRLGNKEAANALARDVAGGFRQPGTGTFTDKDFDNFLAQTPSLSTTAEGRKQITQTLKNAANRDIAISKMARAYEARHGKLDNGFYEEAAQFIAENPVVAAPLGWRRVK